MSEARAKADKRIEDAQEGLRDALDHIDRKRLLDCLQSDRKVYEKHGHWPTSKLRELCMEAVYAGRDCGLATCCEGCPTTTVRMAWIELRGALDAKIELLKCEYAGSQKA